MGSNMERNIRVEAIVSKYILSTILPTLQLIHQSLDGIIKRTHNDALVFSLGWIVEAERSIKKVIESLDEVINETETEDQ